MCLTPVRPATESSILRHLRFEFDGAAPDCVTSIVTIGMSTFGKRVTPRL